jgi:hypothetical protein
MKVQVRDYGVDRWVETGTWFESFADLPEKLRAFQQANGALKRVLIAAPSPSHTSLAFAFGSSRDAYFDRDERLVETLLQDLKPGDLVQLGFQWKAKPSNNKILERAVVVGEFVSFSEKAGETKFIIESNGVAKPHGIWTDFLRQGRATFHRVPKGTPHAVMQSAGEMQEIPNTGSATERWKFYMSQSAPRFAFFGDINFMSDVDKLELYESELCTQLLGQKSEISMKDATRIDQLSNDREVHFVNVFDSINAFPSEGTSSWETLAVMPGVVMIGNRAIEILSKRTAIADKLQVAFWDTGSVTSQDQALQAFRSSAAYFEELQEFAQRLGWEPIPGVKIWGWV